MSYGAGRAGQEARDLPVALQRRPALHSRKDQPRTTTSWFDIRVTDDGPITITSPSAPDWLTDLVYDLHNGELPNEWRYATTAALISGLLDGEDPEDLAESLVDIFHADLARWLAVPCRFDIVGAYAETFEVPADDLAYLVQAAQGWEIENMARAIQEALRDHGVLS